MCGQGHVSGALPPATYGQGGPLTLSQTRFVPPDQTPYTPSSFSGLDSVPSPPVPFQLPPSPGQNLSSGQAWPPSPPSKQPLQNPRPLPVPSQKASLPGTARGASAGTLQQSQHSPNQAGSTGALGFVSTGPVPPITDSPSFLGSRRSSITAFLAERQGGRTVAPALLGPQKAPKEALSLARSGQVAFESSSAVPALAPVSPFLAPRGGPAGQPVAGPTTASQAEKGPLPMLFWPNAPLRSSSNAAEQNSPSSRLSKPGDTVQAFLTTQDIAVSGASQAPSHKL